MAQELLSFDPEKAIEGVNVVKVLLFVSSGNSGGKLLQRMIDGECSSDTVVPVESLDELMFQLKSPATRPDLAVLMVADGPELSRLLSMRKLLHDVEVVLVLPPDGAHLVRQGHLLRPRFLTFADSGAGDLIAVLQRIRVRIRSRKSADFAVCYDEVH